ncbi:MAG: aminopeptidase P family protein [Acholeplasmataceae bacterium]|jgi:Xaa-Pro aminopeptidase
MNFEQRRQNYVQEVLDQSLSFFFAGHAPQKSADQHYPFEVNRNFYYLSGINQEQAVLLIAKGEKQAESYLFIEGYDPIKALWDGAGLSFEEASKISQIKLENVRDIKTLDTFVSQLLQVSRRAIFGLIDVSYFDLERQSVTQSPTDAMTYQKKLSKLYPALSIKTNQMILAELRTIKDQDEVLMIQKASDITKKALEFMQKHLKPGIKEFEAEASYNYVLNMHRTTPSFDTIAAGGKNATVLHYVNNSDEIKDGDLVLFDLGVKYEQYASDVSRTYPVNGKFTKRQKEVYEVVLEANEKTIEWLKAGKTLKEFNDFGKQILIDGAKRLGLIEKDEDINKYYYHSLGHYLGLDVHDVGNYAKPIPEGAIITVEPGLYIAEEGIGIRIEDDILVTKDGAINLTKDILKSVHDIEHQMKK